jgi:chemotaxis protein histidine kinase CheA/ActR/RegA family two-component response regulator
MATQRTAHLSWIRLPIAKSVDLAKLAMESYFEKSTAAANPPPGAQPVWVSKKTSDAKVAFEEMAVLIEQVHSALNIVGSPGGSALSQELQIVCSNIRQGMIPFVEQERALVAVQNGLLMLPGYLAMVIDGAPDSPGILVKYINEIREIRNVPLLPAESPLPSTASFLYQTPPHQKAGFDADQRPAVVKVASADYQRAFGEYLSTQSKESLGRMRKALRDLQEVTHDVEVGCAWWIGECLIEAIAAGGVRHSSSTQTNIRVLSVAIQKFVKDCSEQDAKAALGLDRFRGLLYALSITTKTSPEIEEALNAFGVNKSVASEALKELQQRLSASHAATIEDVIPEIKPQLEVAMVSFGRALSAKTKQGFSVQMEAYCNAMRIISNVFGMINNDELEAAANANLAALQSVIGKDDLSDDLIEQVKTQILFLDQRLNSMEANEAARILNIEGVSAEVVTTVVHESLNEIIAVRNKISIHVASGAGEENLLSAILKLNDTSAAFAFAGNEYIAQLITGVANAVIALVDNGKLAESEQLELAARALVTIELYFSALDDKLTPDPSLLVASEKALRDLGITAQLVSPVSRNELLAKFEEAKLSVEQPPLDINTDLILVETLELRPIFETVIGNPDLRNRKRFIELHDACLRLALASDIGSVPALAKLCNGIAAFAKVAPNLLADAGQSQSSLQGLARSSCELAIRCMDEYASKGAVSLFTKPMIESLQEVAGNNAAGDAESLPEAMISDVEPIETGGVGRPFPADCDPMLMDLFHQEYEEQHERIISFLDGADHHVGEDICLAVHTVNGISGNAECGVIKSVYEVLEHNLHALRTNGLKLHSDDVAELRSLLADLRAYQENFPWVVATNFADAWVAAARKIGSERARNSGEKLVHAQTFEPTDNADVADQTVQKLAHAQTFEQTVDATSHDQSPVVAPVLSQPATSSGSVHGVQAPMANPDSELVSDYDHDMVSFYLDDAEEVLSILSSHQSSLLSNLADKELLKEIKRHMHTLKGAASIAKADYIVDLSHYMESLFESIITGKIKPDQQCSDLLSIVLSTLEGMTEDVRAHRPYTRPASLIAFVEECCEIDKIDMQLLHDRLQGSHYQVPVSVQAAPPVQTTTTIVAELLEVVEAAVAAKVEEGHVPALEATEQVNANHDDGEQPNPSNPLKRRRGARGKRGRGKPGSTDAVASPEHDIASHEVEELETAHAEESVVISAVAEAVAVAQEPEVALPSTPSLSHVPDAEQAPTALDQYSDPVSTPDEGTILSEEEPVVVPDAFRADMEDQSPAATAIDPIPVLAPAPTSLEIIAEPVSHTKTESRLSPMYESDDVGASEPVVVRSSHVQSMLSRMQSFLELRKKSKQRQVQTEKIKVDQRQLDNAVEQANELNASRHRQQAQYEEQMITLSALREKLALHLLNHNKFTASLRGHINRPAFGLDQGDEELRLERFNHLSAMHVQAGVEIEQMLQDCVDMVDQGRFITGSYKQQAGLISSLQSDLLGSRLVPFQNILVPLQKTVEQVSAQLQKTVKGSFTGADTIVDKVLLEGIRDPLSHILKNAIDHGIESASERERAGKPAEATIAVSVQRRAKNVVITVTDDGRGIDPKLIREKAIEKGLISKNDELTDREAVYLITSSGFSTLSTATRISGRGVGMDIVKAAVENIGGLLKIESEVGVGTTFTMELPFTIGTNRAIVCQAGDQWFAIPSYTMTQILNVDPASIREQRSSTGHAVIQYEGHQYDVVHLADLIAMPDLKSKSNARAWNSTTIVLCEQGDTRIAIEVDKGGSMPEIHIKKLDGILSKLRGIIGETEIHDGAPVLVLDVMELVRLNLKRTGAGYEVRINRIRSFRREEKPLAFVVDDASSYRKMLSKHLEARGFDVQLARDGQDALDLLPMERVPDVVILDCEMPRVDGLTLCAALRARNDFKNVPVIMLTTKPGLDEAAAKAGVDIYLLKPFDGVVLDSAIASICPAAVMEVVQ